MWKNLLGRKGEGVVTGILWMTVVAVVSGSIAYSIWAAVGGSAGTLKDLILTTLH